MSRATRQQEMHVLERLGERNICGFKPHGRNEQGEALLRAVLPGRELPDGGHVIRECFIAITDVGTVHYERHRRPHDAS
jgi:hypothetical protein